MNAEKDQVNAPSEIDEITYWLKLNREANIGSLTPLEDAAKQLVTITSLLQGIYFAAVSFSNIKQVGRLDDVWYNVFIALSFFTLCFWMASLYFATRVFIPEIYGKRPGTEPPEHEINLSQKQIEPDEQEAELQNRAAKIRDAYRVIATYKHNKLTTAVQFLWYSFIPFILNILIYLLFLPAPPPK